jgi:choline dehydrogenase
VGALDRTWDHVIVGGGTAGCVPANRLSEDAGVTVLLLEAGGSGRDLRIEIPLLIGKVIGNPAFDWMRKSAPEPIWTAACCRCRGGGCWADARA